MKTLIVLLISGLSVGGAEMMLYKLLASKGRERFDSVAVSLIDIGLIEENIRALDIRVHSLGMRRGCPSPLGLLRLLKLLRQLRPAILQTWLYHADLLGTFAAKLVGVPHTVWNLRASNMDMTQYSFMSNFTVRACAHFSSFPEVVVVNSEAGRNFHTQIGYRPRQGVLIPNGIDTQVFRPDPAVMIDGADPVTVMSDPSQRLPTGQLYDLMMYTDAMSYPAIRDCMRPLAALPTPRGFIFYELV
jgi:glycosyltransferase involved in cell wall biosynthesis